jgi:hypothetical protein
MTSSATHDFLAEILAGKKIPAGKLEYFRARLRGRVHQALLNLFGKAEKGVRLTRRQWAERVQRKPEQITRWLSYPGNPTVDTLSDLFVGLGYEVERLVLVDLATGTKVELPEAPKLSGVSTRALAEELSTKNKVVQFPKPAAQEKRASSARTQVFGGDLGLAERSRSVTTRQGDPGRRVRLAVEEAYA